MNPVICGCSGSGKSTAIRRILQAVNEPIYGFWTKKEAPDFDGRAPVYLHPCRAPLAFSAENLIGCCTDRHAESFPEVFDTFGVAALRDIPDGALVLMDEIGVMENKAIQFQQAVFSVLNGSYRVLLAVRDRETPLLDAIRRHEKSLCVSAQEANTPEFLRRALTLL